MKAKQSESGIARDSQPLEFAAIDNGSNCLKPDRADVIIPAAEIYLSLMKWAKISKIYVPQVGLANGIIHTLCEQHKQKSTL